MPSKKPMPIDEIAKHLELPPELVVTISCPTCGYYVAAGYLAPESYLEIRCPISRCAHHVIGCPYTFHTKTDASRDRSSMYALLTCPGDLCMRPWSPNGVMDRENANYRGGKPVCKRPWARGYISNGSRILVWCSQTTCINHANGFIISPCQSPHRRLRER